MIVILTKEEARADVVEDEKVSEELKKARMGDERIIQLVKDFKEGKDGDDWQCELQNKKHGSKKSVTRDLWKTQVRGKICPFLHERYPDLDLSLLLDFMVK